MLALSCLLLIKGFQLIYWIFRQKPRYLLKGSYLQSLLIILYFERISCFQF